MAHRAVGSTSHVVVAAWLAAGHVLNGPCVACPAEIVVLEAVCVAIVGDEVLTLQALGTVQVLPSLDAGRERVEVLVCRAVRHSASHLAKRARRT